VPFDRCEETWGVFRCRCREFLFGGDGVEIRNEIDVVVGGRACRLPGQPYGATVTVGVAVPIRRCGLEGFHPGISDIDREGAERDATAVLSGDANHRGLASFRIELDKGSGQVVVVTGIFC
jgi:hypothetical protein